MFRAKLLFGHGLADALLMSETERLSCIDDDCLGSPRFGLCDRVRGAAGASAARGLGSTDHIYSDWLRAVSSTRITRSTTILALAEGS